MVDQSFVHQNINNMKVKDLYVHRIEGRGSSISLFSGYIHIQKFRRIFFSSLENMNMIRIIQMLHAILLMKDLH